MKQSELMQLLTNMQRQIEDLSDRMERVEAKQLTLSVTNDPPPPGGGGPGSEESGNGP